MAGKATVDLKFRGWKGVPFTLKNYLVARACLTTMLYFAQLKIKNTFKIFFCKNNDPFFVLLIEIPKLERKTKRKLQLLDSQQDA